LRNAEKACDRRSYGVSKAALNAFTRILTRELAPGEHVNAVFPGWVRTRMGGSSASRPLEGGVKGIVWAATLGPGAPRADSSATGARCSRGSCVIPSWGARRL
jgi:NAD(P)-dependent dehydrogenase (short-subunit alcohol dehydrogenase family)